TSGDNRAAQTLHHFRPSYFLSKFPSRPRGNDRAGISASWKGQRIVFRRRGGRRYRTGMTCRSRRNDPEHARNDEASFLASPPPFDRGYYVVFATPEDLGREGFRSFASWQGPKPGRITDSRYRRCSTRARYFLQLENFWISRFA
ncbi:hypothetical protein ALC57_17802, partial [Trachymyrmex cornetzi]